MKKLFLGSIALTTFSIAVILFQISCQKTADAQPSANYILPPATMTKLGGVMVDGTTIKVDAAGKIAVVSSTMSVESIILYSKLGASGDEIWKANIDGTSQQKINIAMPAGYVLNVNNDGGQIKLTADNQKIVFKGRSTSTSNDALFSCSINGANVVKLVDQIGTSFDVN